MSSAPTPARFGRGFESRVETVENESKAKFQGQNLDLEVDGHLIEFDRAPSKSDDRCDRKFGKAK